MSTNRTSFQAALSNVLKSGEYVEGVSFSLLTALYDMETAFDETWLRDYFKASGSERMETLEKAAMELAPEYVDVVTAAKATDKALPTEPAKKASAIAARDLARRRRKAAQNIMRNAINGLVYLRTVELISRPKVNAYRKLELVFKTAEGVDKLTESFASLARLGEGKAKELGWLTANDKPNNRVTTATPGDATDKPAADKASITLAGSKGTVFGQQLQSMLMLLTSIDFEQLSDDNAELVRSIGMTVVRKYYADDKGGYDMKMLASDLHEVRAISTGDERAEPAAA